MAKQPRSHPGPCVPQNASASKRALGGTPVEVRKAGSADLAADPVSQPGARDADRMPPASGARRTAASWCARLPHSAVAAQADEGHYKTCSRDSQSHGVVEQVGPRSSPKDGTAQQGGDAKAEEAEQAGTMETVSQPPSPHPHRYASGGRRLFTITRLLLRTFTPSWHPRERRGCAQPASRRTGPCPLPPPAEHCPGYRAGACWRRYSP